MKHYSYYIFAALMCCALVCCKEKSNEVIITGQLEGVEDGTVLYLQGVVEMPLLQSDTVVNGTFRFSFIDTLDQPKSMIIMSDYPSTIVDVWVVPGAKVAITGKNKLIRSWDVKSSVPEQKELNKYKARTEQYDSVQQLVMVELEAYFNESRESPEKREELWPKIDSLQTIYKSMDTLILEVEVDCMIENKTYSAFWMKKLHDYSNTYKAMFFSDGRLVNIPDEYVVKLKDLYEGMSDELKSSKQGQSIYANLFPRPAVKEGDDMADADLWNLAGELCHLSDYKGKYILLDFWSLGCPPCIAAMPEVRDISEKYHDKLVVAGISLDTKGTWESASKEHGVTWVNLNDFKSFDGIALRYGVMAIPTYVIISPEGKVLSIMVGSQLLRAKVDELVK